MTTQAYALNERQLELVFNLPYYATLYLFKTPQTPSEAARRLQVPANVMHYRVKRLLEAGLLEVAEENGRSRTYRSVAERFSVSSDVIPALTDVLPAMLDAVLSKLHRGVLTGAERELRDLEALTQNGPLTFDLSEQFSVRPECRLTNEVNILAVDLSETQFRRVVAAVSDVFAEVGTEAAEGEAVRRYTLAFVGLEGQGAV